MRVVDSSAWIEWFTNTSIAEKLMENIPDAAACIVPTIVQLELAKWMIREKGDDQANQVVAYTMTCNVIPLYTSIALLAAEMSKAFKLAMADAVIYATAI